MRSLKRFLLVLAGLTILLPSVDARTKHPNYKYKAPKYKYKKPKFKHAKNRHHR